MDTPDNRPYVFVSYAHANSDAVLPIVNAMSKSKIDLWYDEGITAGSEWPEFIAERVVECSKFVLFVSNAYLDSQNCKRELNFAISRKKDILSIFLEDVQLSPGMEMQLGTYQAIHINRFPSLEAFRSSICQESFFDPCRGGGNILVGPKNSGPVGGNHTHRGGYTPGTAGNGTSYGTGTGGGTVQPGPTYVYQDLPLKNKWVAVLLALFLGSFGIHKFYLKKPVLGVLYLIFFWTYIPSFLALIDTIVLLCSNDARFRKKYKCRIQ